MSHAEPTSGPSETVSSEPSPSPEPSTEPEPSSDGPSTLSCATSQGVYAYPTDSPSWPALPPWVSSPDGPSCVQVVVTWPQPDPTSTADPSPTPAPSPSQEQMQQLLDQVVGLRELLLYAGGLTICCLGVLVMRTRGS